MAPSLNPMPLAGLPAGGGVVPMAGSEVARAASRPAPSTCYHCGQPCPPNPIQHAGHDFCCLGCQTVFALIRENGLDEFYRLGPASGPRVDPASRPDRWAFLDDPTVTAQLLDYQDERIARVTFHVPAIHCVACVWLLENLFRLQPGIGRSRVHFGRREVSITYDPGATSLSKVAGLLTTLGYEPSLTLAELDRPASPVRRRLAVQIAVAGFAFGNIMLFSLPQYLGLDSLSGPAFRWVFGILSLILAFPVIAYSAGDYWRSAFASLRQRTLTLDVPIAAGLAALYAQSAWEILAGRGEGYLDSTAGLVFFLLCGRAFQQKSHERLGFDRDYRGFFPLAVRRKTHAGEESVALSQVTVGDRLVVRHGELVPADARLVSGEGLIDYSFVTGESDPVTRGIGDHLYAGGRQTGGAIEVETLKPVSQSYLTSLWNDDAFRKQREDTFESLTNRYSRRFTRIVVAIAIGAAAAWSLVGQPGRGLKAFTSVLIVACPCALALAAPFTLGTAQRLLSRRGVFLRNSQVVETMAAIDVVAFDKTGTLTEAAGTSVSFSEPLDDAEAALVAALCSHSVHPHARHIGTALGAGIGARTSRPREVSSEAPAGGCPALPELTAFEEVPGRGMRARHARGGLVLAGSRDWLAEHGVTTTVAPQARGSAIHLALDGRPLGVAHVLHALRPEVETLFRELAPHQEIALLSGDHARDRARYEALVGDPRRVHFNLSPHDKLAHVRELQAAGRRVMMVGDGLNDAGALRQGDVGVAVVEGVGRFSPASDVILDAAVVPALARVLDFTRRSVRIVRAGFAISGAYNVVGVAIAAAGILSPIICAILMPLSSVTVVAVAVGATRLAARRAGLPRAASPGSGI